MKRRLQTLMMMVLALGLGGGTGWGGTVTPPPGPVAGSTITVQFIDPLSPAWIAPATVPLIITAYSTESGVTIRNVSVYKTNPQEAANLLGQAPARPDTNAFDYTWAAVAAGDHHLYAVATDSNGKINTSLPLTVTVTGTVTGVPDLLITGISLNPVTPVPAASFTASVVVKNQGSLSNGGTLTLAPFAGASGVDLLTQSLPVIAGGDSVLLTFTVPARPAGENVMTATVAVPSETVIDNNAKSVAYTVATSLPSDLTVSVVKVTPAKPLDDTPFTAVVTVKNLGKNASAGGTLTLTPAVGVTGIAQTVPAIAKTKSLTLTFTVPGQTPGAKKMTATLSAVSGETKTTNNSKTLSYTVTARPDFSVTAVAFSKFPPVCTSNSKFTAYVTVLNAGGAAKAGYLDVWINYAEGQAFTKRVAVSTIGAGRSKRVTVSGLLTGVATGEHVFRAMVDSLNTARESNEGNNVFAVGYTACAAAEP